MSAVWRCLDHDMKSGHAIKKVCFNGPLVGVAFRWQPNRMVSVVDDAGPRWPGNCCSGIHAPDLNRIAEMRRHHTRCGHLFGSSPSTALPPNHPTNSVGKRRCLRAMLQPR